MNNILSSKTISPQIEKNSLLHVLPLEIRHEIYKYILRSPTGSFELMKTSYRREFCKSPLRISSLDDDGVCHIISLAFLRTCKQIYQEAKGLLWKYNVLDLEGLIIEVDEAGSFLEALPGWLWWNPLHIRLDMNVFAQMIPIYDLEMAVPVDVASASLVWGLPFSNSLVDIEVWAKDRAEYGINLQSVTVHIRQRYDTEDYDKFVAFKNLLKSRETDMQPPPEPSPYASPDAFYPYMNCLQALRATTKNGKSLADIKRTLVIEANRCYDPEEFNRENPGELLRKMVIGDPISLLAELATCWGGDIVLDDVLCCRQGRFIEVPFVKQVLPTGVEEYYFTADVDLWIVAGMAADVDETGWTFEQWYRTLSNSPRKRAATLKLFEPSLQSAREALGFEKDHRVKQGIFKHDTIPPWNSF